jgi:methionyl-tRNA formyltransferase
VGAAPINWAIMNGEKETGITTFKLQHEIDTGNILLQEKIRISDNETAGELHDKLKILAAHYWLKLLQASPIIRYKSWRNLDLAATTRQISGMHLKFLRDTCRINWNESISLGA